MKYAYIALLGGLVFAGACNTNKPTPTPATNPPPSIGPAAPAASTPTSASKPTAVPGTPVVPPVVAPVDKLLPAPQAMTNSQLLKEMEQLADYAYEKSREVAKDPGKRDALRPEGTAKDKRFRALMDEAEARIKSKKMKQSELDGGAEPVEGMTNNALLDFGYLLAPSAEAANRGPVSLSLGRQLPSIEAERLAQQPPAVLQAEINAIVAQTQVLDEKQRKKQADAASVQEEAHGLEMRLRQRMVALATAMSHSLPVVPVAHQRTMQEATDALKRLEAMSHLARK